MTKLSEFKSNLSVYTADINNICSMVNSGIVTTTEAEALATEALNDFIEATEAVEALATV